MEAPFRAVEREETEVPLLNGTGMVGPSGDYRPVASFKDAMEVFMTESKKLWRIALPITFNILCIYGIGSTTQIFVGHIGSLELSAVAIGLSVISTFAFGFLFGMGSALETLCGQAFGAGQVYMLGVYLQRAVIIQLVFCVILTPLYIFATPVLELLGQESDIAKLAGEFSYTIIPQMFSLAILFPTQKFLQAQSKVWVLTLLGFIVLLTHIFMCWLFIFVFDWGIFGAGVAYDISNWTLALSQMAYIMVWCKDGWKGFSWLAWKDIWAFVRLSLASAVMLCLEIWYMMTLVVLTGHLANAQIAVGSISICMNINGLECMFFIGINAAISVRVSNELGSGRPRATKYSVIVIVATSLFMGLFFMALILIFRTHFAIIFTSSEELQQAVAKLSFLLGVTMVLNSIQPVISGVAVGGGWQALVAYINLACYYVLGLPFGFFLGYKLNYGVEGIWIGMLCGTAMQTLILLGTIWKTNWKKEARYTLLRWVQNFPAWLIANRGFGSFETVDQASERVKLWGGQEDEPPKLLA